MMAQQSSTMNSFMQLMARTEERRYEGEQQRVPQNVIQGSTPATPSSTITNSQQSLSQLQITSPLKRSRHENDDETTAASTVGPLQQQEREEITLDD
jgi:hypothetical protein